MLDDFRDHVDYDYEEEKAQEVVFDAPIEHRQELLGMTPAQRFVVSMMLFFIVTLLSGFALLVTEKVVLPI